MKIKLVLAVAACAALAIAPQAAGTHRAALCGGTSTTSVKHVVWIWMENHSYTSIIGPSGSTAHQNSPYVNGTLAASCGLATNYRNLTHPSLPNYLGATSGSTHGVTSDCSPSSCPQSAISLFEQLKSAGRTWRGYDESMPSNCSHSSAGLYAAKHNPAVYYTRIASSCSTWDVPLGSQTSGALKHDLAAGTLPSFSFVTPNLCDDTHSCSIKTGDNWLKAWIPLIAAGANYRSGNTVVFVTWDEGSGGSAGETCTSGSDSSCHIATLVVDPKTSAGTRSGTLFTQYSLLKTTEQLLGVGYLGHAADSSTASMRSAFGL